MNQDAIQKNYYEQLMVGNYIDVKYTENEWKIARVIERDKRYALVAFDGINTKQEQVYLGSFKVAPLRMQTQGYTGSLYKVYRPALTPISEYKHHLEILQQTYLKDPLPNAFTITQYLRGQLFVIVHSLLCRQDIKEQQGSEVMMFLVGFIDFVYKLAFKIKKMGNEYFQSMGNNKSFYLVNEKAALVNALTEQLILLNIIIKAESSKHVVLFKNRHVNQDTLVKYFTDRKEEYIFADLFRLNDGNGKWLSFSIHRHLYYLIKKYIPKFAYPDYKLKDYQEALQIYPFIIKEEEKGNIVEEDYLNFITSCLKEQSSFQAKLRALQELKKILEEEIKLFSLDQKYIHELIGKQQIVEHMLNEYHFNPEIFKRFIPILQNYCKVKSFSIKNVNALFKLAATRHESEVSLIYEIICSLAEFIQVDVLDSIYTQIIKNSINNEQTLKLIKNFTIKAIINYSKQKSFLSTFFKRSKNSGKYGYYGLDLFFKEIQDDGSIIKANITLIFQMIKQMFGYELFHGQRMNYISTCIGWIQKGKNYGQAIKIIDGIISSYSSNGFFSDSKKQTLQKLVEKYNIINLIINNLKNKKKPNESKLTFSEIIRVLYEFIDNYYDAFVNCITIEHIEYLWSLDETKLLADFLKKNRGEGKKRYIKKIDEAVQDDILNKLIRKQNFYNRNLIYEQFEALDEIFISYNIIKKKVEMSERGVMRYLTTEMEGYTFYFEFILKLCKTTHVDKMIRKTVTIFLRPKDEKDTETKINTWKMCLLKLSDKLKENPEICLKAINIFFEMIEGRTVKENLILSGNIDIIVTNDGQEKIITLTKNSTIFRLRKQIMIEYNLVNDFTLYSLNMRRDITFAEEEEYSLNALPLQSKGPSIAVVNRKKEKHQHLLAVEKFKELIEKEQMFYEILFSLNNEKSNEIFWKTVDLLPVNRQLVRKIENCTNFNLKQWRRLLKTNALESLQYHLNIIYDLMQKNKKWISLFYSSDGMGIIAQCLQDRLKQQISSERIINRCLSIIIKMIETIDKIDAKLIEELNITLIAKLISIFKVELGAINLNVELLNNLFNLLNKLAKISKENCLIIDLDLILKILQFGIFKPKNKYSLEFIESHFEHYLINNYSQISDKLKIYEYLLNLLKTQTIVSKEYSELMFIFLIDYMNTFIGEEHPLLLKEEYMQLITNFIMTVLLGNYEDHTKYKYNHLIFGAFKLLIFTMGFENNKCDFNELFDILLKRFLLNKESKRIKHETTLKLLYECLKKLLFTRQDLISILVNEIAPQLQKNQWRKNLMTSWSIESKRQQRSLYCGLQNLGATCYINCLIQQLFMIEPFRENFISIDSRQYKPLLQENEIYQLQSIFSALKFSNKRSITTKKFCDSFITYEGVPINPMVQSDSDQFFNALMEKVQSFLKYNKRHEIVENSFEGILSNQLNCEGCPHKSEKQENFLSIGVNIRGKKCLQEALEGFVQGEILDGDNAYFCEICQKKVRTQKRLCIKQLPNILIIVLKRFEFNYDEMKKIKINSYLNFPFEVNMKKYTAEYLSGERDLDEEKYGYSLRGTVIHSGTSQGGHYYSFARAQDKWYSFNDEFIEEINVKKIEEDGYGGEDKSNEGEFKFEKYKNAYILFYEKLRPTESYKASEKEILNPYTESIKRQIITQNNNADFLSVMLDGNFVRLGQNISALQSEWSYKFTLLYFHTVVLRDRNKDEYIPNYYRIIDTLLKKEDISEWYLSQMNYAFFREFLIEPPRIVRFTCTSLVIQALKNVKNVPKNVVPHGLHCLNKHGMNPFAAIFKELSMKQEEKKKLIDLHYPERAISLLLEQSNNNFAMIELQLFESYFGVDSSQKPKDREICFAFLCESLKNFDIPVAEAVQIFQKHFSRNGSKVLAKAIASKITEEQYPAVLSTFQTNIIKDGDLKREDIEKLMFLVRYNCLDYDEDWRMDKSIDIIKKIVYESRNCYEPMETLIRELVYISARKKKFEKKWKNAVIEKDGNIDLHRVLKYWLKQAQKPQFLSKSDEFKRKISSVNFEEKYQLQATNKSILDRRMTWMLQKEGVEYDLIESDVQDETCNRELVIRNKRFKIKEHMGLVKKVEIDGQERWGILEKNELDIYQTL